MQHAINKVFNLINKTGDRCIVLSQDSDEAYVVMSLAEYERMTLGKADVSELSEDELLDKINRDIAMWKSQQDQSKQDDIWVDDEYATKSADFDPGRYNLADTSQNFDEYEGFDDDFDYQEPQEEPYYFEKV